MVTPDKMPWTQRRFVFDLPVSMFPNVLERLRGTPARLAERIDGLDPRLLTFKEGEAWSLQETIGHLISVEDLWLGRLEDFAAGLEELRPADMTNRRTYDARYNDASIDDLLAGFRTVRAEFVGKLEGLSESAIGRAAHHPRPVQPMRVPDLMVFAAEHGDHHLATITGLIDRNGTSTSALDASAPQQFAGAFS